MTRRDWLLDRMPYIILYGMNLLLIVLIVQLDLWQRRLSLSWSNLLYLAILSGIGLGIFLVYDYGRQRGFHKQLTHLIQQAEQDSLETTFSLGQPITREQVCFEQAVQEQYRRYADELATYRKRQELREHFVQRWVHQMKTPLSVIDLILQEQDGLGLQSEALLSLKEEKEKLTAGLEIMLHQTRLEQFSLDFVVERVNLVDNLRHVINSHKAAFIRSGVFPRFEAKAEEAWVETDAKWLHFTLSQVVVNAIKYSRLADGKTRQIILAVESGSPGWQIRVQDEGIGILPQDLPRIFQPFFTGENGRRFPEATGMGLYLAKEVCDRLGHVIAVESTPNQGTTFTLTFPPSKSLHAVLDTQV